MAWTTPRTWVSSEVVSAAIMNTHVRDNLLYLFGLALVQRVQSSELGSEVTTTATSATDVTGLSVAITSLGGRLKIYLLGPNAFGAVGEGSLGITAGSGPEGYWRAVMDSTNLGSYKLRSGGTELYVPASSACWEHTPAAGAHTIKIQHWSLAGSVTTRTSKGVRLVVEEWTT